ncbi:Putative O-antigen transporter [Klebsiella spallanzanii]|uniref:O-antigen transporter n=1 Tax=Klebsiella spallanzanii TaxID=2587528 RepID=A0ABY6VDY2_9ENTR|nr:oligosaccharide flippase family protein [Klebsiella spallanzanii]VUS60371.1 Putative O-antigen transporter [Klebsiella spallanzanii]
MKNIKNFLHVLLLQGGNYIFPIVTIPIASRIFGPELIGVFNYYTYIVSFYCMIVEFGFGYSGVRLLTRDYDNKSLIFNRILLAKFIILLLVSLVAFGYLYFYTEKDNFTLFISCYLLVLSSLFNVNWFFQSTGDFSLITKVSLLTKMISIALIVIFINTKDDLLMYAIFVNVPMVLSSIFSIYYCVLKYKIKLLWPNLKETFLLIKNEVWIFLSKISSFLYTTMGVIFLGFYASSYDVGIYTSAQKIVMLFISAIITPLSFIVFPALSKRFGVSVESGLVAFRKFMPLLCLCCFLSFLFIFFFGGEVILIMMGKGFEDSIYVLKILAFGYLFVFWGAVIGGQIVLNLKYDKQFVLMQWGVAFFSFICNILFLKKYGSTGLAYIWTISECIMTLMQVFFIRAKGIKILDIEQFKIRNIIANAKELLSR